MSMSYIKKVLPVVFVLFTGCSSTPDIQPSKPETVATQAPPAQVLNKHDTSASELAEYKTAITHLNNDELDKAYPLLKQFTENRPELAGPWANLGLLLAKQNKLDEAAAMLTKAIERNPGLAQALNIMGYVENLRGNYLQAETYYIKAITVKPEYSNAHYNLALLYDIYYQDVNKAIPYYEKYLKLVKNSDKETSEWLSQIKSAQKGN